MTNNEIKQQLKNEALNKIIKSYGINAGKHFFDRYDQQTYGEQRDTHINWIVETLLNDLKKI